MISGSLSNITYQGISIDTRTLKPGNLFFAIIGETLDGHDFVEEAFKKGAAGAVISKPVKTTGTVIQVKDTTQTLGDITKAWREKFSLPLIGLTGSNGKTTTKNMLAHIFSQKGKTLSTRGNLNNQWGMPLMLAELSDEYQYAIIEMGMNHFHEIAYLTKLAKPTMALITNAGPSHLEGVGNTVEGVAKAKGEIFEGLTEDGIAVINADDEFCSFWKNLVKNKRVITFGLNKQADVWGEPLEEGFNLHYKNQSILIKLKLLGDHNIRNAVSASAVALVNGIEMEIIKKALEDILPEHGRMETKRGLNHVLVIDDTYNSNPLSLKAAIDTVKKSSKTKILVLADMRELGEQAVLLHEECGKFAKENNIDFLFATGELMKNMVKAFGENAKHFENQVLLIEALKPYLNKDTLVLVKGSRSMKMENVVEAIL